MVAYLDRLFVSSKKDLPDIGCVELAVNEPDPNEAYMLASSLAYSLFEQRVFQSVDIVKRLQAGIGQWVTWERTNRSVRFVLPCSLLKSTDNGLQGESPV